MLTASAAMEAFVAATKKTQPQNEQELEAVLSELPRRELLALSKTHGVQATLKRESLVAKLLRVLVAQLWPTQDAEKVAVDEEVAIGSQEATTMAVTETEVTGEVASETASEKREVTETTTTTTAAMMTTTAEVVAKTETITKTAKAVAVVGKKPVVTTKRGALSPGKLKKATPVKATAMTPSKNMAKLHAKQIARQPTLQEHEQAKKKRAALLLSGSKYSVVKKTRSKVTEMANANGDGVKGDCVVAKTLKFGAGAVTPAKTTAKATTAAVKETTSVKKVKPTYKPHAGPLPAFAGDSLFSPKKVEPRLAPMATAVMKAARVAAPKNVKAALMTKKATPLKKVTPTKKSPVTKSPARKSPRKKSPSKQITFAGKENIENTAANATTKEKIKPVSSAPMKKAAVATTKARVGVKATTMSTVSQKTKTQTRRDKFTQDTKTKSTASRQQARAAKVPTVTTSN